MTLLDNIKFIDNRQDRTIHDYIDNYGNEKSMDLVDALTKDYYNDGVRVSYDTLNHYACLRKVWINWSDETRRFYDCK